MTIIPALGRLKQEDREFEGRKRRKDILTKVAYKLYEKHENQCEG
jgi:hypothetical protein